MKEDLLKVRLRLLSKAIFQPESGCWQWTGSIQKSHGYGRFGMRGHNRLAHRISYELFRGPIPAGLDLDHLCRNRWCINPDHLDPVPHFVNVRRGSKATSLFCKRGHQLLGKNLRLDRNGYRKCMECNRVRMREWKGRNKEHVRNYMREWKRRRKKGRSAS